MKLRSAIWNLVAIAVGSASGYGIAAASEDLSQGVIAGIVLGGLAWLAFRWYPNAMSAAAETSASVKGDFHALANELRRHLVQERDISALEDAIAKDEGLIEIVEGKFGPSVVAWLQSMPPKAVDSSRQIELEAASSLLAPALQKYYG